jgi:hypothetical protein
MSLKTATAQASTLGEPIKKEKLQVRANLALTSSLITCCDNVTQDGKVTFRGSVAYITNSTGNLSMLNNMLTFLRGEGDINTGNFNSTEWELK